MYLLLNINVNRVYLFYVNNTYFFLFMTDNENRSSGNKLLYLTDKEITKGIEAMMFAYRGFTSDPDEILARYGYGRAHHRALHFIQNREDINVTDLLKILAISKQSLNRVLRRLIEDSFVEARPNPKDRRSKILYLTPSGKILADELARVQTNRVRLAYRAAGNEAVLGFRRVLENLINPEYSKQDQDYE